MYTLKANDDSKDTSCARCHAASGRRCSGGAIPIRRYRKCSVSKPGSSGIGGASAQRDFHQLAVTQLLHAHDPVVQMATRINSASLNCSLRAICSSTSGSMILPHVRNLGSVWILHENEEVHYAVV